MKKYCYKDWKWPATFALLTLILSLLAWWRIDEKAVNVLADTLIPIVFSYATTLFGLLIASYTILQGYTNEHVKKMKSYIFYPRYKRNLLLNLKVLVAVALVSVFGMVAKGLLPMWLMKLYIGLSLSVVSFTLIAAFCWVGILIKHFDAAPNENGNNE